MIETLGHDLVRDWIKIRIEKASENNFRGWSTYHLEILKNFKFEIKRKTIFNE